jgi:hypothetical protein
VIVAEGWSDEQCRAYTLVDNKLAEGSKWDDALLEVELADLTSLGVELDVFGFDVLEDADPDKKKTDASSQLGALNYTIVIRCSGEAHQVEMLEWLEKEGLTCKVLIS